MNRIVCTWHESTPNHYVARITANASIEARRPRSWRRYGMTNPWQVILFGNPHTGLPWFASLEEAQEAAEKAAVPEIQEMARKIGLVP